MPALMSHAWGLRVPLPMSSLRHSHRALGRVSPRLQLGSPCFTICLRSFHNTRFDPHLAVTQTNFHLNSVACVVQTSTRVPRCLMFGSVFAPHLPKATPSNRIPDQEGKVPQTLSVGSAVSPPTPGRSKSRRARRTATRPGVRLTTPGSTSPSCRPSTRSTL